MSRIRWSFTLGLKLSVSAWGQPFCVEIRTRYHTRATSRIFKAWLLPPTYSCPFSLFPRGTYMCSSETRLVIFQVLCLSEAGPPDPDYMNIICAPCPRRGDRVWRGRHIGPGRGLGDELTHRLYTASGRRLRRHGCSQYQAVSVLPEPPPPPLFCGDWVCQNSSVRAMNFLSSYCDCNCDPNQSRNLAAAALANNKAKGGVGSGLATLDKIVEAWISDNPWHGKIGNPMNPFWKISILFCHSIVCYDVVSK